MRKIMHSNILVQCLFISILKSLKITTALRRDEICRFPSKWEGTWFQSGVPSLITIEMNRVSSKGRCLATEGDKFLVVDDKSVCYRCIVIHEKHTNVLQYKETFCHDRNTLYTLCSLITGDALLYSMFRMNAQPVHCPFKPPMTFTYSRGHGECKNPMSNLDGCIEESRIVLRYQACPDVSGTESAVEELECVATWKEGSSRYLVGKVSHGHITSNEDRFRCFVYEKASPLQGSENGLVRNEGYDAFTGAGDYGALGRNHENFDFRLAQSGDATCNGLFSATEGSRTLALKKAPVSNKCKYPTWLTYFQHWHTLDYRKSYTFHHRNTTLKISNNSAVDMSHAGNFGELPELFSAVSGTKAFLFENGEIRLVCSEVKFLNQTQVNIVAHFTIGCESGYVCLWFYRRDIHVIEVQSGSTTRRIEDACHPSHFTSDLPFVTLVTINPEPRECPYNGKFSVSGISQMERQKRASVINEKAIFNVASNKNAANTYAIMRGSNKSNEKFGKRKRRKRRNTLDKEESCEDEITTLEIGCDSSDTLEFRSQCASSKIISEYSCHGRWNENETNFLITTPQSRTSLGAKRYCFIYKEVNGVIHFSSSSQSCIRNINAGVEGVLAFNATILDQCHQTSQGWAFRFRISSEILLFIGISIFLGMSNSR